MEFDLATVELELVDHGAVVAVGCRGGPEREEGEPVLGHNLDEAADGADKGVILDDEEGRFRDEEDAVLAVGRGLDELGPETILRHELARRIDGARDTERREEFVEEKEEREADANCHEERGSDGSSHGPAGLATEDGSTVLTFEIFHCTRSRRLNSSDTEKEERDKKCDAESDHLNDIAGSVVDDISIDGDEGPDRYEDPEADHERADRAELPALASGVASATAEDVIRFDEFDAGGQADERLWSWSCDDDGGQAGVARGTPDIDERADQQQDEAGDCHEEGRRAVDARLRSAGDIILLFCDSFPLLILHFGDEVARGYRSLGALCFGEGFDFFASNQTVSERVTRFRERFWKRLIITLIIAIIIVVGMLVGRTFRVEDGDRSMARL